jgi:hypothetical protein
VEPFKSKRVVKLTKFLNSLLLKSRFYCIHKLIGKVFNLHYEEYPIKGVSQDPRKDKVQNAMLYLTGVHMDPKTDFTLVIDHIDGVKNNNDIRNLRLVTQRNNAIASQGKACVIFDPETDEWEEYRSITLAQDDLGYRFDMCGGKRGRCLVGKAKSKGILWKGHARKKLWFSYLDEVFFISL